MMKSNNYGSLVRGLATVALVSGMSLVAAERPATPTDPAKPAAQKEATGKPAQPGDDFMDTRWREARINIDWIFADKGAHNTYDTYVKDTAYRGGEAKAKVNGVLWAQNHNKHVQDVLRDYGSERILRYLASLKH